MTSKNKKFVVWLIIIALIITSSLINLQHIIKSWFIDQDKLFHLTIFAMFMVVTHLLFPNLTLIKTAAITFALGFIIEILQEQLTHGIRHFHLNDILANTIGIGLGAILLLVYKSSARSRHS